ncbi:transcriptional regulator, LysR family [Pseudoduganella flava]|uniref:LysR family transcriptional regulator n=1 Tax=Pseudoduganella flava TaxID=871742 RepID=A0A562PNU6_9BURK|nr:LysR family transcriptional regulator [Pseudoduganella flava]QGZ40645.1 LysR family transcriptional regulator [Pseudoduganella flava]TWI46097.1 transcriptional regulator, LysR family [Pseudoduganella flava]
MNDLPLLDDLRLFCAIVRHKSFAATARALGVSNAYVSKRLGILEETMQARLLHRTTRTTALTEQGQVVHGWALRILEDVEQMAEAVSTEQMAPSGLLRICTSSGFGRNRVSPALSALALRYPALEIQLELLDRAVDLIGEDFHLDIRVGQAHEPHLISRRIARNARVLCAAPAYLERHGMPATLAALAAHRCIVIRERHEEFGRWTLQGPRGPETVKVGGPLSAANGEVVHQWALDGHGIILRSLWDVGPALARGALVRVLPDYEQPADVWAIYPSRLSTSAKLRVCVEFLEEWLARHR